MVSKLKLLLSRLRGSKDGRSLTSNFGYLLLLQISTYLFPIITIPYLARVIGVEGFGKIAFAAAIVLWLRTVTDWGFSLTATRDIARHKEDIEKVSEIFSNVFWAKCLLGTLSLILLTLGISFVPYFNENRVVLLATFLIIPGNILFPEWFFQAIEKMKFITVFNIVSKGIFTLMVFIFIKEKEDFILQPLFISLGFILSGIVSMYIIIVDWKIKILKPNLKKILQTIKNSSDVFINKFMPNLYNSLSVVLLGFWAGDIANGIYSAGRKFLDLANSFMDIMIRVSFPFLSRKIEAHNLFAMIYLFISGIASLTIYLTAPIVIEVFLTNSFREAVTVLQITSISLVFSGLIKVYGTNYLILEGYERPLRNITILFAIIGLVLSIPLVYYYSYIGAAITLVFTQALLGLAITSKAMKVKSKYKNTIK